MSTARPGSLLAHWSGVHRNSPFPTVFRLGPRCFGELRRVNATAAPCCRRVRKPAGMCRFPKLDHSLVERLATEVCRTNAQLAQDDERSGNYAPGISCPVGGATTLDWPSSPGIGPTRTASGARPRDVVNRADDDALARGSGALQRCAMSSAAFLPTPLERRQLELATDVALVATLRCAGDRMDPGRLSSEVRIRSGRSSGAAVCGAT